MLEYPSPPGTLLRAVVELLIKVPPAISPREALLNILWAPREDQVVASASLARLEQALSAPLTYHSRPFGLTSSLIKDSQRSPLDCLVRQLMTSNAVQSGLTKAQKELFAEIWGSLSQTSQQLRQDKDFDERAVQAIRHCLKALQETHQLAEHPHDFAEERLQNALWQWHEGIEALEKLLEKGLALLPSLCPSLNWLWRQAYLHEFWPDWADWVDDLRTRLAWSALPGLGVAESEISLWLDLRESFRRLHKLLCSEESPAALQSCLERLGDLLDQALDYLDVPREHPLPSSPLADLWKAARDKSVEAFRLHKKTLDTLLLRAQETLLDVDAEEAHELLDELEEVLVKPSAEGMHSLHAWLLHLEPLRASSQADRFDHKA